MYDIKHCEKCITYSYYEFEYVVYDSFERILVQKQIIDAIFSKACFDQI